MKITREGIEALKYDYTGPLEDEPNCDHVLPFMKKSRLFGFYIYIFCNCVTGYTLIKLVFCEELLKIKLEGPPIYDIYEGKIESIEELEQILKTNLLIKV